MISKEKNFHLLFLLIISVSYLFPFILFGKVTTFYHDNLDSVVVYNHVIGKIYRENFNFGYSDIFLAGEIKYYYLRHIFKPFVLLYSIFNTELAYWTTNIIFKITCYLSFFQLSKKISKDLFISFLGSILFVCLTSFSTLGFGLAIFPYVLYLIIFKSDLNIKHYFLIIFFGLNTDLIADFFFIPVVLLLTVIINKEVLFQKFSLILKILTIFLICSIITSSNMIFIQLFGETMHRVEFNNQSQDILKNVYINLVDMFKFPTGLNFTFFKLFPYTIILTPILLLSIFSKEKIVKKLFAFIFFLQILSFLFGVELIVNFRNTSDNFFKTFNLLWISYYLPIIHALLFIYLASISKKIFSKVLIGLSLISIVLFQLNSSAVPFIKKFILKEENYRNIYTFEGYYLSNDYLKIKKIVNDSRVLSVGLDPMVAVMNDIKVIDGYHSLYPLSYKKKFRKIIENELKNNEFIKNYYDNWGSRIYAFTASPQEDLKNFDEAKKLGAEYVVSKNEIVSDNLSLICKHCSSHFKLYKIK